jgi:hypothetical protein
MRREEHRVNHEAGPEMCRALWVELPGTQARSDSERTQARSASDGTQARSASDGTDDVPLAGEMSASPALKSGAIGAKRERGCPEVGVSPVNRACAAIAPRLRVGRLATQPSRTISGASGLCPLQSCGENTPPAAPGHLRFALLFLTLLGGLLLFCHGCHPHDDIDDELFSRDWWVSALGR